MGALLYTGALPALPYTGASSHVETPPYTEVSSYTGVSPYTVTDQSLSPQTDVEDDKSSNIGSQQAEDDVRLLSPPKELSQIELERQQKDYKLAQEELREIYTSKSARRSVVTLQPETPRVPEGIDRLKSPEGSTGKDDANDQNPTCNKQKPGEKLRKARGIYFLARFIDQKNDAPTEEDVVQPKLE
ncbi:hypothetical protein F4818DRAFT_440533 [Hypoxylon cercidicola]|nr:hypothetical protein F4818DRAFT_440533 [Hypoxylon cercidicola]